MTRGQMLQQVAAAHRRWSERHGDTVPYRADDAGRADTDLPLWQATVSAPAAVQDELWSDIDRIVTRWRSR